MRSILERDSTFHEHGDDEGRRMRRGLHSVVSLRFSV